MKLGNYVLSFKDGGVEVAKDGKLLYFNRRPLYVMVKDYGGMAPFSDVPYASVDEQEDKAVASGELTTRNGSVIAFEDVYTLEQGAIRISRKAVVKKAEPKDIGYATKISLYSALSDEMADFEYFEPGEWYKHNEYAGSYAMGKDMTMEYYWRKETACALPMFAMRHSATGETASFSRWAADVQMASIDRAAEENYTYVDEKLNIGSVGMSKAKPEAITYTYYSHQIRTPLPDVQCDGLSIDYVYPCANGQVPERQIFAYVAGNITFRNWVHPMREGFTQDYSIAVTFGQYDTFQSMMKATWREVYPRLKDRLAEVDNHKLFDDCLTFLTDVTQKFGDYTYGTPFAAQLPDFDPDSYSAEMGFVGQQIGVGYQLLRWGTLENKPEAVEKGVGIVDFWVKESMMPEGFPKCWLHLSTHVFEPQPIWIRQIGDGLENVLDAYVFMKKHGIEKPEWFDYCVKTADWLVKLQNEDGSYYRAYKYDGKTVEYDSKANTPSVVRFLMQMYLVSPKEEYKEAALKAGQWSYDNLYVGMEYRGGTCDQLDVQDKEAGIYALFAFLSLYDITEDKKWLEAACGAADYTETYTYIWNFPVMSHYPKMSFNFNHISGQSFVTCGGIGADVYMAACIYVYYRLYLLTGDEHYLDFAEFLNLNTKQANDLTGDRYKYAGLVHESGSFADQVYRGRYHWLPWCTYVEIDPVSRLVDTFGAYEIADIEKLPLEERQKRNRIYDYFA